MATQTNCLSFLCFLLVSYTLSFESTDTNSCARRKCYQKRDHMSSPGHLQAVLLVKLFSSCSVSVLLSVCFLKNQPPPPPAPRAQHPLPINHPSIYRITPIINLLSIIILFGQHYFNTQWLDLISQLTQKLENSIAVIEIKETEAPRKSTSFKRNSLHPI